MAGDTPYEKFMFDTDFDVLAEEREKARANANAEPDAAAQAETTPEPEPEPEAPTYSEEDLEQARVAAHAEGRQQGMDEAASAAEKQIADTLNAIVQKTQALFDAQAEANQDLARDAVAVAAALVKKLFPTLNQETAVAQIEQMLREALGQQTGASEITVRVPADLAEGLHDRIEGVSEMAGFRGDIKVLGDPALAPGDCRLEWASGGVSRSTAELAEQLDEIVARHLETDATRHPGPAAEEAAAPEAAPEAPDAPALEPAPGAPEPQAASEEAPATDTQVEPEVPSEPTPMPEAEAAPAPEPTPEPADLASADPAPAEMAAPAMPAPAEEPLPAPSQPSDDIFAPSEEAAAPETDVEAEPVLDADDIAGGPPPVPSEEFLAEAEADAALHPHMEGRGAEDHAPVPSDDLTAEPEPEKTAEETEAKAQPVEEQNDDNKYINPELLEILEARDAEEEAKD